MSMKMLVYLSGLILVLCGNNLKDEKIWSLLIDESKFL